MSKPKLWPEAHPDVIRTILTFEPWTIGIRVVTSEAEFREAMTYASAAPVSEQQRAEVERIAGAFDRDWRVLLIEAYPEVYKLLLGTLVTSYEAMVPFVSQQRRKRAIEN